MELVIVAVYDLAVGAFGRPVFVRSKGEALRSFQNEVNKAASVEGASAVADHPEHFQLFFMGTFDDSEGRFTTPEFPEKLVDAHALKVVGSGLPAEPGRVKFGI